MSGNQNPIAVAGLWNIKTWIFYFLISSTFVFTNLQFSPNILRIPRTKRVLSNCAWIKSLKTIGMESDPDAKVAPATVTRRGKTTWLQAIHSAHRVIQSDPECLQAIQSAHSSLTSLCLILC